jgi:uncharacterized metal-binding protein
MIKGKRVRIVHVSMPNGDGNDIIPIELGVSMAGEVQLAAWMSNFGGCNVHILDGEPSQKEAEEIIQSAGVKGDILMTVTGAGESDIPIDLNQQKVSVYFEGVNEAGITQVVAIEIREL